MDMLEKLSVAADHACLNFFYSRKRHAADQVCVKERVHTHKLSF